jgi:hypothetical protein
LNRQQVRWDDGLIQRRPTTSAGNPALLRLPARLALAMRVEGDLLLRV